MSQKKHLNAIAALEASKDAEPGSKWNGDYCGICCEACYASKMQCVAISTVSEVRAALQSGLAAHDKRKAEKAERIYPPDPDTIDCILDETQASPPPAPLIPDPPDTPEVRALMEHLATEGPKSSCSGKPIDSDGKVFCFRGCPFRVTCMAMTTIGPLHDFAVGWLERHRKPDAGDFPMFIMRDGLSHPEFWNFPPTTMQWRPATHADVDPLLLENKRAARERIKEMEGKANG